MTAEPTVAAFVAIDELFLEKRVILVGMKDEYTYSTYMPCVKDYLIHRSYRRGISRRLREAVGKTTREHKYDVDGN